jgi:mono/diheme cytochrome c family protein
MSSMLLFLGRFHVVVLHLPLGILLLAALAELLSRRPRFASLASGVGFLWGAGAASALLTVALGLLHAREGGFDASALRAHGLAGGAVAAWACAVLALRTWVPPLYRRAWPFAVAGMFALLALAGHLGGNLTHGETYLIQYAPSALQRLVGPERRARPTTLAAADLYLDVVAPALAQRCSGCHNAGKRKGELDLSSYKALMKGGEKRAVIVAGKPGESDLFRRISLAHDDKDFMPKEGKTPLSADQVAAIGWWISRGAPQTGPVLAGEPPKALRAALERVLGFTGAPQAEDSALADSADAPPPKDVAAPSPDLLASLAGLGFEIRPVARDNPLVLVDYVGTAALGTAQLEALAKLGPNIQTLNLRSAGVVDAQLATIGRFTQLVNLRLELNPLTDAGIASLTALHSLRYLNLYGTRITDQSVPVLAKLEGLQRLYVWQTGLTPTGAATLQRSKTGLELDAGFDTKRFPVGPKLIPVVN